MPKAISTARGREFGEGLVRALKKADLSGREIAEIAGWHESKISNLACGKGGAGEREVAYLLGACRVVPDERDHLLALLKELSTRGWWQQHGSYIPAVVRTFVEHLKIADSVVSWQTHVVPYFLRTPGYARAVVLASANIPASELDERLMVQAQAHKLTWSRPSTFYIHESALLLPVGGPEVQADQLRALLVVATFPKVAIRIVPIEAGAHAGLSGSFTKLDFKKCEPMICLENETSTLFVEDPDAVKGYEQIVKALDVSSLDIESSKSAIQSVLTALERPPAPVLAVQPDTQ